MNTSEIQGFVALRDVYTPGTVTAELAAGCRLM
jgi:hypothetical protein